MGAVSSGPVSRRRFSLRAVDTRNHVRLGLLPTGAGRRAVVGTGRDGVPAATSGASLLSGLLDRPGLRTNRPANVAARLARSDRTRCGHGRLVGPVSARGTSVGPRALLVRR